MRYDVLDNAFLYARYKHANKPWLVDFTQGTFTEVVDYLGDKLLHLKAAEDADVDVQGKRALSYERPRSNTTG